MKKFIKIFKKIYSKKRFGFGNNWLRFSENNIDQNIDFAKTYFIPKIKTYFSNKQSKQVILLKSNIQAKSIINKIKH